MSRALCGLLPDELQHWLTDAGEPAYRASQILSWVHRHGRLDPREMTNVPARLRQRLADKLPSPGAEVTEQATAADGTRKLRVDLAAGGAVETVLIPEGPKVTQCLSTQVGCAFRCRFCLSGSKGLDRSLQAEEILAQVHLARAAMTEEERLSNVVLMGSGEPLANYAETVRALKLLTLPEAVGLSSRRVTVSTIGLPRGIERLGRDFEGKIGLAVSLHGADDATRARLLPKIKAVPLDGVIAALRAYPLPKRRRITIEYALVRDINESEQQAERLAARLRGIPVKINLIPFNTHHASDLEPPNREAVLRFQQILIDRNYTVIIRRERGADIGAACGQLIAKSETTS